MLWLQGTIVQGVGEQHLVAPGFGQAEAPLVLLHDASLHPSVEAGEHELDGPPLVLQHAITDSLAIWQSTGFTRTLRDEHRLILIDARGHGASDKPHDPAAYTPASLVSDFTAVLAALGLASAHYWGYSLGAMTGLEAVRLAPTRLRSLILGGCNPYGTQTEAERQPGERLFWGLEMAVAHGMPAYVAGMEKRLGPLAPAEKALVLADDPLALLAAAKAITSLTVWPGAEAILPTIAVPCLIYAGEADALLVGAAEGARHVPLATFVTLPGGDHAGTQKDDRILPYIRRFLKVAD